MLEARWIEHILEPKFTLGTSKGTLSERTTWYLLVHDRDKPDRVGIGETAPFPGHSKEFPADVRTKLIELCADTTNWAERANGDLVKCLRYGSPWSRP